MFRTWGKSWNRFQHPPHPRPLLSAISPIFIQSLLPSALKSASENGDVPPVPIFGADVSGSSIQVRKGRCVGRPLVVPGIDPIELTGLTPAQGGITRQKRNLRTLYATKLIDLIGADCFPHSSIFPRSRSVVWIKQMRYRSKIQFREPFSI
jgi:hypothetical protein